MSVDPWFLALAVPVVVVVGLSKGGFLPGMSMLGVPLLSLAIPPVEAAAIMLPLLITMDAVGVWSYRHAFDRRHLLALLPAALLGIAVGWLTAAQVTEAHVRLMVGIIGLAFAIHLALAQRALLPEGRPGPVTGAVAGALAGFTSFISHSGIPPVQIYLLPQKLPPLVYAGTVVMFFAAVNAVKVLPFAALGLLGTRNLSTSLVLLPVAFLSMLAGVHVVRRIRQEPFYRIAHACLLVVSLELIREGGLAVLAG